MYMLNGYQYICKLGKQTSTEIFKVLKGKYRYPQFDVIVKDRRYFFILFAYNIVIYSMVIYHLYYFFAIITTNRAAG